MKQYRAGCLCGAVRLRAVGQPDRVGLCHCLDCRKYHGSLFHASAIFPEQAVAIEGDTREWRGRHFCPICGSAVYQITDNEIEVNLGALDESNQLMPTMSSGSYGAKPGYRRFPWRITIFAIGNRIVVTIINY
ncbi:GFA family protein [Jejubacter sp. L23]|uniref:GFA family protein n=1 Tax=Jejubacter sp. L23 TaxID=3092086 RepID=UPI003D7514FB